jgi:hypothetical protein
MGLQREGREWPGVWDLAVGMSPAALNRAF